MSTVNKKDILIEKLISTHIFALKPVESDSGKSPYEIRLSTLCSYPYLLKEIAHLIYDEITNDKLDLVAGPYTDIPLATTVSLEFNIPMLFIRKERKEWGMEKLIEGSYQYGQKVAVVDDQIDDVASALQIVGRLEGSGLKVVGYHTLFDRYIGEIEYLKKKGINFSTIFTINDILVYLVRRKLISQVHLQQCKLYIESKRHEFQHLSNYSSSPVVLH